jgi:hypothetical protein
MTAAPAHPRANPLLGLALDLRRSQIRTYERMMRAVRDREAGTARASRT